MLPPREAEASDPPSEQPSIAGAPVSHWGAPLTRASQGPHPIRRRVLTMAGGLQATARSMCRAAQVLFHNSNGEAQRRLCPAVSPHCSAT
ncbi:hypothetical protein NDU88_002222 [Pleurodeles waltl]|uniref:Uncharacterized protein n=1 Tax=Pleurodeles waltl TaxID=8319 RepID=A0AAV7KV13_PLEWA|nr:hypothetical protein NDU88_002222 [Pleurodeles waltl]